MENTDSRRWWVLAAMVLAMLAIGLDATVLSVALPTLAGTLQASTVQLQWFVAAYTLVLAVALLPGGLLGDRYGRRRMLLISLAIFGLGSLGCAYAPDPNWFIAARVLAGVGAAFATPMSLSVLTVLFSSGSAPGRWASGPARTSSPSRSAHPRRLAAQSLLVGLGFLINLPVVVAGMTAVVLLMRRVPRRPATRRGCSVPVVPPSA